MPESYQSLQVAGSKPARLDAAARALTVQRRIGSWINLIGGFALVALGIWLIVYDQSLLRWITGLVFLCARRSVARRHDRLGTAGALMAFAIPICPSVPRSEPESHCGRPALVPRRLLSRNSRWRSLQRSSYGR